MLFRSILLVVTGHFFDGSLLWIPVTVGLFVFAYSSAYFTSNKYHTDFSPKFFWASKAWRLGLPFWVTHTFLLMLFLISGRNGIWTWQTALHWVGQSGWLNWLALANPSPFGNGLWFFTLLLIYYLLYPAIARCNASPQRARISVVIVLILALILHHTVQVGHVLWVTVFAFWFGSYSARYPIGGRSNVWLAIGASCALTMLALNFNGIKLFNIYLIVGASIAMALWLERVRLQKPYLSWILWLSPCVLEIYLIHTYLFVDWGLTLPVRFMISMVLIIASAQLLSRFVSRIEQNIPHAHTAHS